MILKKKFLYNYSVLAFLKNLKDKIILYIYNLQHVSIFYKLLLIILVINLLLIMFVKTSLYAESILPFGFIYVLKKAAFSCYFFYISSYEYFLLEGNTEKDACYLAIVKSMLLLDLCTTVLVKLIPNITQEQLFIKIALTLVDVIDTSIKENPLLEESDIEKCYYLRKYEKILLLYIKVVKETPLSSILVEFPTQSKIENIAKFLNLNLKNC